MSICRTCGFTHPESDCPRWPARERAARSAAARSKRKVAARARRPRQGRNPR